MITMPLDHFSLVVPTSKVEDLITFLTASLQHVGFKEHMRPIPTVVGLGEDRPYIWITGVDSQTGDEEQESLLKKHHIAFTAHSESPFTSDYLPSGFTPLSSLISCQV